MLLRRREDMSSHFPHIYRDLSVDGLYLLSLFVTLFQLARGAAKLAIELMELCVTVLNRLYQSSYEGSATSKQS